MSIEGKEQNIKTKVFDMEVYSNGKPKVWFVERFDVINHKVDLYAVCTSKIKAEKYKRYFDRKDREDETHGRTYVTERILDHLFGASMTQSI